jgi:FkbM family methyltransferase
MILGTFLGRIGLNIRDAIDLAYTACAHYEAVGTLANDVLARVLVTRICRNNKIFIDVGAHIGSVIAEVIYHTPSVRIIAFEAIPEKVAYLRRKFPQVKFHACALSESEGEATFFVNNRRSGYSSLRHPSSSDRPYVTEVRVPLKRLDGVISSDAMDVLKIDVEGAELGVLRGGNQLIAQSRPTIVFESGPYREDGLGYTKESLWQWFAEREYAVLVPNRVAHIGPGMTQDSFLESHLYPRRTTNYFAVPIERRAEIRDRARDVLRMKKVVSGGPVQAIAIPQADAGLPRG